MKKIKTPGKNSDAWENATLANNFLRPKHSFGRDSLKTLLKRFAPFRVAHYAKSLKASLNCAKSFLKSCYT